MRVKIACEALKRGCCLEIYYPGHSIIVEVHAAGWDVENRPAAVGWLRLATAHGQPGLWRFIHLDEAEETLVSGYLSDAPRASFLRHDKRFRRIRCQL